MRENRRHAAILDVWLNPVRKTAVDLEFALEVIRLLEWRAIESPGLSLELFNSALSLRAVLRRVDSHETQVAATELLGEIFGYLDWAVRFPETTAALEGPLMEKRSTVLSDAFRRMRRVRTTAS